MPAVQTNIPNQLLEQGARLAGSLATGWGDGGSRGGYP